MPERLLELERFSYRYPTAKAPALRDVALSVEAGEFVVVAGRSGSGKTSLLRAAAGLIPHFFGGDVSGEARVCGLDLREAGPAEIGAGVGFVAQDPETQVVAATPRAELELPLEMRGVGSAARARAIEEASLALGINELLDRPAGELSGGELQRVALAAALVSRPRLVVLDEPTSQLDPVAGDELIGLLRRLNEEWGTAILLAEHRLARCLAAADRTIAIAEGRIAFDGAPAGFLDWALGADPKLATPAARMFELAGIRPAPVSVKQARAAIAGRTLGTAEKPGPDTQPAPRRRWNLSLRHRSRGQAALDVRDLWVELETAGAARDVLRGLDARIEPGERVALMGRNGAGKTTMLRALAGILEPLSGSVSTPGGWALVPQNPSDMLVRERVGDELPGEAGLSALWAVGLDHAVDSDPRDLSGGERQRLALAIAMAGRERELPGLACFDEPTRGMDAARKEELSTWLGELGARGTAVLVATHDVEFAARFAERVLLMGEGRLLADGSPSEVLSGGWYFATEVARILGGGGAVVPERGAELLLAGENEER
ncbi:energy-coupling factor transporter ATPase [soil metagenome]